MRYVADFNFDHDLRRICRRSILPDARRKGIRLARRYEFRHPARRRHRGLQGLRENGSFQAPGVDKEVQLAKDVPPVSGELCAAKGRNGS